MIAPLGVVGGSGLYSMAGLERVEEIRQDYARLRLPYRPEYEQPAGVVHGGCGRLQGCSGTTRS